MSLYNIKYQLNILYTADVSNKHKHTVLFPLWKLRDYSFIFYFTVIGIIMFIHLIPSASRSDMLLTYHEYLNDVYYTMHAAVNSANETILLAFSEYLASRTCSFS